MAYSDRVMLETLPVGSIVTDDYFVVVAIKVSQRLWTVSGYGHVVTTPNLENHGSEWKVVRDG